MRDQKWQRCEVGRNPLKLAGDVLIQVKSQPRSPFPCHFSLWSAKLLENSQNCRERFNKAKTREQNLWVNPPWICRHTHGSGISSQIFFRGKCWDAAPVCNYAAQSDISTQKIPHFHLSPEIKARLWCSQQHFHNSGCKRDQKTRSGGWFWVKLFLKQGFSPRSSVSNFFVVFWL